MIRVDRATGLTTVQDLGWRGLRSIGLPPGGAMDSAALRIGNALVGNPDDAAGLEVALGELTVVFERTTCFAVTGAALATVAGEAVAAGRAHRAAEGEELVVRRATSARFGYLAVAGGVAVDPTLGSRSTYLPSGLGGHHGRRLQAGDQLPVGSPTEPANFGFPAVETGLPTEPVRLAAGPQGHLFPNSAHQTLAEHPFRISPASDRMGARLEGPALSIRMAATLPSEGTCVGAVQVPDDGQPIVVLRDGPTVGGYPKIGAVIGADLARFAQTPLGDSVRFTWVSVNEAQRAHRAAVEKLGALLNAIRGSR